MPPLDLSDSELATAAQACRARANQERERARKMENPSLREIFMANVQRNTALAEKLEKARKTGKG